MAEKMVQCPVCNSADFKLFMEIEDYFLTKEEFSVQECVGCGFKFVNPRPDSAEIGRYYQSEEYISHDAGKPTLFSRIYKLARVFSIKNKYNLVSRYVKKGRILDIGCGTGEFLNYCQAKGFNTSGVEPSEKAGQYAREVNGIKIVTNLTMINSGSGLFDCITMWHVLEHVHELNNTLELVKELLHSNGVFIVAVPNCTSWDAEEYGKFWAAYDVPRHLYHFSEVTMKRLVTKHGFECREVLPQKLDAFYVSMLSEKYRRGRSGYLKPAILGFWSNFKAKTAGRGYSSQIFVLTRKNP
ncbi:MAG: class I SAM-dependent methyltransferase [Bacteroidales bacterium]